MKKVLCSVVIALLLQCPNVWAIEEGFTVWNGFFARGPILGHWSYYFEQQLRLSDGANLEPIRTRGNRWLLRPALIWNVPSIAGLQVFVGGALTPNFSPERGEQRIWEQLQYSYPVGDSVVVQRMRLEQRHIEFTQGLSHRIRYLARLAHAATLSDRWGYVIWDEVFWNLNTLPVGPQSGFDQNRIFAGPMYRLSPQVRAEVGYLGNWIAKGSAPSAQWSHVVALFIDLDLSQKAD